MLERTAYPKAVVTIVIAAIGILLLPGPASAAKIKRQHCGSIGGVGYCTYVAVAKGRLKLDLGGQGARGSYRLCVRGPAGKFCRRLHGKFEPDIMTYFSTVDWQARFPHDEDGPYYATWRKSGQQLGPRLKFRKL